MNNSAVCWQLQKIFASQCDKLFIFWDRNQSICKCVTTARKDLIYQFLHRVTTHLKFSKNWQLSCLLTCLDNFFITMSQTVYGFRQKFKNICKSLKTVRKGSAPQFLHRVTQLKYSKNWQLNCLLTFSDNFFITMFQTAYTLRQKFTCL